MRTCNCEQAQKLRKRIAELEQQVATLTKPVVRKHDYTLGTQCWCGESNYAPITSLRLAS